MKFDLFSQCLCLKRQAIDFRAKSWKIALYIDYKENNIMIQGNM